MTRFAHLILVVAAFVLSGCVEKHVDRFTVLAVRDFDTSHFSTMPAEDQSPVEATWIWRQSFLFFKDRPKDREGLARQPLFVQAADKALDGSGGSLLVDVTINYTISGAASIHQEQRTVLTGTPVK